MTRIIPCTRIQRMRWETKEILMPGTIILMNLDVLLVFKVVSYQIYLGILVVSSQILVLAATKVWIHLYPM